MSDDLVVSIIGPYFINNYFDVIEYTNDENNYIILKGRAKRNFSTQTYC
ncbi:MAG TPA: hypothetical protein P5241_00880 [Candidatus Paceibacterota bacterium]|nr:hypothetical protein [Candidatus Paceibacterota bacterium]